MSNVNPVFIPPLNFSLVVPGIFRSGYPNQRNFSFLRKLQLKSVIYLSTEDYTPDILEFWKAEGIKVFRFPLVANREPLVDMDETSVAQALRQILDSRIHPVLVHCNKGKHRIGCVAGLLRRIQGWSMAFIFDEYKRFCAPKLKIADQEFIELYKTPVLVDFAYLPDEFKNDCSSSNSLLKKAVKPNYCK